ncbi:MAG: AsmA family protein [Ignavibacteriae bacterium]|nr:AsmA family protein [Ignavibacteriota bacterium]
MALSRTSKIWIGILSIPLIILFVGILALNLYFTSERLKELIIPEIEASTHRTVSVRDASFSILPRFSIRIEGLKISNKQGETFDKDEFVSVETIDLEVKILELLRSRLEMTHLLIDKPKLYLEVTSEGITNYSDEQPGEKSSAEVKVTSDRSGTLLLSNFEVRDGEIVFIDKKGDSRMYISGYNQTASATKFPAQRAIELQAEASMSKFSYGSLEMFFVKDIPIKAHGKMTFNDEQQSLSLDDVEMLMGELPANVTGTIADVFNNRSFDLTITASNGEMKQVLSLIPPDFLKATNGLSSSGNVAGVITMKGESSDDIQPEVKGDFSLTNGTVQYTSLPKSITNVNVAGSFIRPAGERKNPPPGSFEMSKLSASLGGNNIGGSMKVIDFNDPNVTASFNGSMNLNEVKEFYPLEQGTEMTGTMKGNLSLEGKAKTPASIKASGAIEFQNATIKTATSKSPVSNLNGTITFNNQNIESKKLSMMMGESDVTLSFLMKNYLGLVMKEAAKAGKPTASVTLTSRQLRTVDLMSDETESSGTSENNKEEPRKAMMLPGMDVDANVNIGTLVTEKFEFTNAKGALSVKEGIVKLNNFSVNAFEGNVVSKGTLDLRDAKKRPFDFDLDIKGVQSNSMLSKFTSFGNNLYGKLTMKTKLTGELDDTLGLVRQALTGDGNVSVTDGKLLGFALTSKLAEFTGLDELKVVNINNWSNIFSISNGKVNINDLKIKSGSTDFIVNGTQGLDGSLDYNLNIKLPGSISDRLKLPGVGEQLVQFFKDESGRISLSFLVGGMHTSPTLKLDTKPQEEMAKQALQKKVDEGKKKVEDELKKKLGEGLNKFLKKPH